MENINITTALAFGGFCLSVYNCLLELVRRHPRCKVCVRKIVREDGVDIGFSASAVNTGEVAFTVRRVYLVHADGRRSAMSRDLSSDKIPKVVHPGEQCEVKSFDIGAENQPVTGDVVRIVFTTSSGKEFRSNQIPRHLLADV